MRQVFRTMIILVAMTVMAGQPAWANGVTTVTNWSELKDAINDGAVIELSGDDVYYPEGSSISIDVEGTVTIDGKGHTIDAARLNDRIFVIDNGATLILKNLTLKNVVNTGDGGAIYSSGTLIVDGCTFTNNTASTEKGGAIYNNQGKLKITNSRFEKNPNYSFAIYNYANEDNLFKLTMINCTMIEDKVCVNYNYTEKRLDDKTNIDFLTTEYNATIPKFTKYAGTPVSVQISVSGIDTDFEGNLPVNITNTINDQEVYVKNGTGSLDLNFGVNKYTARFKNFISLTEDAFDNEGTKPYEVITFKVIADGSLSALEDEISKATGNTVTLDKDYIFDSRTDDKAILINNKTITIDGNGHCINGKYNDEKYIDDALFVIDNESDVTLKNITLENGCANLGSHNGSTARMGGAIYVKNSTLNLINATLKDNTAAGGLGGAIYSDRSTLNIIGTTFTNNTAKTANSLYVQGGNGVSIINSSIDQADIYNEPDWDHNKALAPIAILKDNTLTISGTGDMANFTSAADQPWKDCRADIKKVTIGADITSISDYAFSGCSNLKTVLVLGESLPTLGTNAFDDCTSLSKIFISPAAYDENEYGAEPNWSAYSDKIDQLFYCGESDEKNVMCYFTDDDNDDKIETLTIIGTGAIMDCSSAVAPWGEYKGTIENLIIEDGVTEIGNSAFRDCTALTSDHITMAASVTHIRPYAFDGCTSLTTAPIGSSVRYIGNRAFGGCTGLTSANIPAGLEDGAKDDEGLVLYNGFFSIYTFEGCTSLTTITVAEDNPTFKAVDGVLMGKDGTDLVLYPQGKNATSYTVPNGVKRIIQQAFKDCSHLTNVTLPGGLKTICQSAFENCTGLTLIMIPASVTNIEAQAFRNCSSLKTVYVQRYDANGNSKITTLGYTDAFEGCHKDLTIYVPIDALDTYKADGNWSAYATKIKGVKSCGDTQSNRGMNVLWEYDPETTTLRIYPNPDVAEGSNFEMEAYNLQDPNLPWSDFLTDITTVIIEEGVTEIGNCAFQGCTSLTSIDIPASVKSIFTYAFENCGFTTFTFPNTVTNIGLDVFRGCSSLQSVTWSTGANSIPNYTFTGCEALASFTIPDNVTDIGTFAFEGCTSLTSIDIPASVKSIGDYAFVRCENLKTVSVRRYDTTLDPSITTLFKINNNNNHISVFDGCHKDLAIYVPVAALDTYKEAENWYDYEYKMKAFPVSVTLGDETSDYISLAEAVAYAGQIYDFENPAEVPTLTLYDDIDLGGSGVEFGDDESTIVATLDLNGHTMSGNAEYLMTVDKNYTLTVTGDGTIGDDTFDGCCIANNGTLILSALPTFVHAEGATNCTDIDLGKDAVITFDQAMTAAPTAPIVVKTDNATPYVFTSGYGANVKGADGSILDPASFFVFSGANMIPLLVTTDNGTEVKVFVQKVLSGLFSGSNLWTGYVAEEDLIKPDGLTAYAITALGTGTVTATALDCIPKGEPVLLKRDDKTVNSYTTLENPGTAPTANLLRVASATSQPTAYRDYVLYQDAFVLVGEGTLADGKVFLPVTDTSQSRVAMRSIVFDDETTGIVSMDNGKWIMDNEAGAQWYSLDGRRLEGKPTKKGLYIHNGKKEVVK